MFVFEVSTYRLDLSIATLVRTNKDGIFNTVQVKVPSFRVKVCEFSGSQVRISSQKRAGRFLSGAPFPQKPVIQLCLKNVSKQEHMEFFGISSNDGF